MVLVGDGALLQHAVGIALSKGYRIDCVFCNTDRTAAFYRKRGISFELANGINEAPERVRSVCTDGIGFSIDNALILKAGLIDLEDVSFYGIHSGIIPVQRGNPVVAAIFSILQNSQEYGVSLFKLDTGIDTGEILAIKRFPISRLSRLHEVVVESALLCQTIFEEHVDRIVHNAFKSERISMGDTKPYSVKDLGKLQQYCEHVNFDRATDFGIFDRLLPKQFMVFITALRELRLTDAAMTPPVREILGRQLSYWERQLADLSNLRLPNCSARADASDNSRACFSFSLSEQATAPLMASVIAQHASKHAILLAAFYALLARYTGLRDLCVGAVIRRTKVSPQEGLVASATYVVPLRAHLIGQPTCIQLVSHVTRMCAEAEEYADIPFDELLAALCPDPHSRLFDLSFQVMCTEAPVTISSVDQAWTLQERGGQFEGLIEYDNNLFNETIVARLKNHYEHLLEQMLAHPDISVFALELLTPAELESPPFRSTYRAANYFTTQRVHKLFEEQVDKAPGAVAIICPDGNYVCYEEVNARANQLARYLVSQGVTPEARVGICLERGVEMIIGILGILKAGGAFVPMDPVYPKERIAYMLEDAAVSLLLTQRSLVNHIPMGKWHCAVIDDATLSLNLGGGPSLNLCLNVASTHLAYVMYTSGSTGKPKGVMVEHRSLFNAITATQHAHSMLCQDRFLSLASVASDTAVWQLLAPLSWGACVVLNTNVADPCDILRCIDQHDVTTVDFVPTLLCAVLDEVDRGTQRGQSLQFLISGGEALTASLLEHANISLPHCTVFNAYGPTETSCQVTFHRCYPGKPVSIGVPIPHTQIHVLSNEGKAVPIGVVGEIVIGGAGVARGYLNQPELTREKFVRDPFSNESCARMYKSGDLGRFLENGEIEYIGRLDNQVKIRGHRVELAEIEKSLREFPEVIDVIVLVADEQTANCRMIGYVILRPGNDGSVSSRLFTIKLREHLQRQLPTHMVPAIIVALERWPLTQNGKVDRKALSSCAENPLGVTVLLPPRNEIERVIARIWAKVLGVESIGVQDHFLDLGGHSLLAIRLIADVRAAFDVELSLGVVSEMPTVELMAAFVATGQTRKLRSSKPTRATLLHDATLPPQIRETQSLNTQVAGDVLLTGATGFLGRHLLCALLQNNDTRVHCLVRGSSREMARSRIRAALELTGANINITDRVNIVVGDLRLSRLGLSLDMWSLLAKDMVAIYHLGAIVNHVTSYASLLDTNVKGTLEILRLAVTDRIKMVNFVSSVGIVPTCAASSSTNEVLLCNEPPSNVEGYTSSKWVADQLVAKAGARGVPVCIFRIGYVGPHSTSGDANASGWFELYLRTVFKLGSIPADAPDFPLTPVDLVVDSIVELARRPVSVQHAFHLLHRQRVLKSSHVLDVARRLGHVLTVLSRSEWRDRLASYCVAFPNDPSVVLGPYLDAIAELGPRSDAHANIHFQGAANRLAHLRDFNVETVLLAFLQHALTDAVIVPLRNRGLRP